MSGEQDASVKPASRPATRARRRTPTQVRTGRLRGSRHRLDANGRQELLDAVVPAPLAFPVASTGPRHERLVRLEPLDTAAQAVMQRLEVGPVFARLERIAARAATP